MIRRRGEDCRLGLGSFGTVWERTCVVCLIVVRHKVRIEERTSQRRLAANTRQIWTAESRCMKRETTISTKRLSTFREQPRCSSWTSLTEARFKISQSMSNISCVEDLNHAKIVISSLVISTQRPWSFFLGGESDRRLDKAWLRTARDFELDLVCDVSVWWFRGIRAIHRHSSHVRYYYDCFKSRRRSSLNAS